jgi:hypothetical protein
MERNCYCREGATHCGTCYKCGAPGHTRHAPGAPATLGFCDRHYEEDLAKVIDEDESGINCTGSGHSIL